MFEPDAAVASFPAGEVDVPYAGAPTRVVYVLGCPSLPVVVMTRMSAELCVRSIVVLTGSEEKIDEEAMAVELRTIEELEKGVGMRLLVRELELGEVRLLVSMSAVACVSRRRKAHAARAVIPYLQR